MKYHIKLDQKRLRKLDAEDLRINEPRSRFAKNQIEWLGLQSRKTVIISLDSRHSKFYLYRKKITIITDYRALLCIMKKCRSKKSYKSQSYEHLPCTRMGLLEYISREQTLIAPNITQYDKHFIIARTNEPMKDAAKTYYKTTLIL